MFLLQQAAVLSGNSLRCHNTPPDRGTAEHNGATEESHISIMRSDRSQWEQKQTLLAFLPRANCWFKKKIRQEWKKNQQPEKTPNLDKLGLEECQRLHDEGVFKFY